jgi:hypothetical protein
LVRRAIDLDWHEMSEEIEKNRRYFLALDPSIKLETVWELIVLRLSAWLVARDRRAVIHVTTQGNTKKPLSYLRHPGVMKLMIAMAVALLILMFADANYNAGIYTRAVASIVVQVRHSFGVWGLYAPVGSGSGKCVSFDLMRGQLRQLHVNSEHRSKQNSFWGISWSTTK